MDLGLADRVAIVTGASRGIGRAITLALVREGAKVILCSRSADDLRAVLDELPSDSEGRMVVGDVRDHRVAEQLVATASGEFGRLDILVNNAGVAEPHRLEDLTDADWVDAFELIVFAPTRLAAACLPLMRSGGWGRIINIASTHGREPDPWFAPYSAAKAALINITKTYGRAYAHEGLLTSCLIPGITETEMVAQNTAAAAAAAEVDDDEIVRRTLAKHPIPVGRFTRVDEVAAAALFLASEQAGMVTGSCLVVDGGSLRSTP